MKAALMDFPTPILRSRLITRKIKNIITGPGRAPNQFIAFTITLISTSNPS